MTTFADFISELRWHCGLTDSQVRRAIVVATSYGRMAMHMPSRRRMLREDAGERAYQLLDCGTPVPEVRDRLMLMGLSRRASYRVISAAADRIRKGGAKRDAA